MQRFGLHANLDKCYFFKENVTYCGHEILKVKKPENVTEANITGRSEPSDITWDKTAPSLKGDASHANLIESAGS
jgi:hypothetical protein